MTDLSPRHAITATAAGALTACLPARAGATTRNLGPNDRRLVDLWGELQALKRQHGALFAEWCERAKTLPPHLDSGKDESGFFTGRPELDTSIPAVAKACNGAVGPLSTRPALYEVRAINRHMEAFAKGGPERHAQVRAEGRERVRHWVQRHRDRREAFRSLGLDRLSSEMDALYEREEAVEDTILATPANGPAGLLVKLRIGVPREERDISEGHSLCADRFGGYGR